MMKSKVVVLSVLTLVFAVMLLRSRTNGRHEKPLLPGEYGEFLGI